MPFRLYGADTNSRPGGQRSAVDDLLDQMNQNRNQGATGGAGPGGAPQPYGQRGRSGQQVYNPETKQWEDQPGIFQGGTSNRRPGLPQQGIVGSPNLGLASEINRLISQGVLSPQQAAAQGLLPDISSWRPMGSAPAQQHAAMTGGHYNSYGMWQPGETSAVGYSNPAFGSNNPITVTTPQGPRLLSSFGGGVGGGVGGGAPNINGQGYNREQSPFEQNIQSSIEQLMNPQFGNALRTREGERISGLTAAAGQSAREDAVRRGASSSALGDTDIRDQLNRVSAEGTRQGRQADLDIDMLLNQIRSGAVGQGIGLLGQQLGDVKSIREMITMLEALKQQNSPVNGLQFSLGG